MNQQSLSKIMIFDTSQLMSNSLSSRTFTHSLPPQFILSERNDTVLENLSVIDMILSKSMSVTGSIKMKSIMIMSND